MRGVAAAGGRSHVGGSWGDVNAQPQRHWVVPVSHLPFAGWTWFQGRAPMDLENQLSDPLWTAPLDQKLKSVLPASRARCYVVPLTKDAA